jgi:Maltose acetyltransferase
MDKTANPAQTERSKMLRGEMYLAMDPELAAGVNTARHEAYRQMLGRGFHTDLLGGR